jgi:hypothetical protein
MSLMETSGSARAAKEFLIHCIVNEAQIEELPLTETERGMLYFSETAWTLPTMPAISEDFDRGYDQRAYEAKISQIIRNFKVRAANEDSAAHETWNNSVHFLKSEDHYILVMIGIADGKLKLPGPTQWRKPTRMLKLLAIGIVGGIGALLITFVILFIARR